MIRITSRYRNSLGFFLSIASIMIGFASYPSRSFAASYDVYVDEDADSSGDGTEAEPYASLIEGIEKAASNAKGRRKVYIKGGKYAETVTIEEGVSLYGSGRGKTRIEGSVSMRSGSRMQDLTIDTNSVVAVSVAADADVRLRNIEIKSFGKIGLDGLPGNGKVVIENSAIHDGGGKGVYIQKGRSIEIVDSEIYKNKEEGIDLRDNVNGTVRNNDIYENDEGGIELIIGSSDLAIVKNHITKNRASGIATQFYKGSSKLGKINIHENVIQKNGNHGIDCKVPSGGNPQHGYWNDSLSLEGNIAEGGGAVVIAKSCKMIEDAENKKDEDVVRSVGESASGNAIVTKDATIATEPNHQQLTAMDSPTSTQGLVLEGSPEQFRTTNEEGYSDRQGNPIDQNEKRWDVAEWFRRIWSQLQN